MEFIVASVVAIGAFFLGASIGRDTGRKEVIADIRRRMAQCIQNESGMLKEWGIKADTIVVDYLQSLSTETVTPKVHAFYTWWLTMTI